VAICEELAKIVQDHKTQHSPRYLSPQESWYESSLGISHQTIHSTD
jgi:hypothetical protein